MNDGPLLFARYAYPPNVLGYCGPGDSGALLEHADAGVGGSGVADLARRFDGAWPYLQLIAASNAIADPLDARVVRAYWLGGALVDRVDPALLLRTLDDRFRRRAGRDWDRIRAAVAAGSRPDHAFHVLTVYPWVGLLREGRAEPSLTVLDRCRIRWGRVESVDGASALVRAEPLAWDGHHLTLGPPVLEPVTLAQAGRSLAGPVAPGDWVSLHWDWVCDRLGPADVASLRQRTCRALGATVAEPVSA